MKHVLFAIPYGLGFRNIVCCDVLRRFEMRGGKATVLLPALPHTDDAFVRSVLGPTVAVRRLESIRPSLFFTSLKALKQYHYARRTELDAFKIKFQRRRRERPLFHWTMRVAERAGETLIRERTVDLLLNGVVLPFEEYYGHMLDELSPGAVAVTKPGFHPDELPLLKAARKRGIPSVALDTTWDNMASKRPPYIRPDRLTVWNAWMAGEAVDYYGFPGTSVSLTGGTQFDVLFRQGSRPDRATTLQELGLDPRRQVIVFSLNGPTFAPDSPGYIRLLLDAIRSGAISGRPGLVVRMHPFDRDGDYRSVVAGHPDVHLQRGFAVSTPGSAFECLPTREDVQRYGALMTHADLLINQASTTSLDAMATDTPVVNIAFDLVPTHPDASVARIYGFTHYRRIVDSGAVRLTHTPDELFATINAYLADRALDQAARRAARERFITFDDGEAAQRVAGFLWDAA